MEEGKEADDVGIILDEADPPFLGLTDLPSEILYHIFSFMPPRTLLLVERTCHLCREIATSDNLWKVRRTIGINKTIYIIQISIQYFYK